MGSSQAEDDGLSIRVFALDYSEMALLLSEAPSDGDPYDVLRDVLRRFNEGARGQAVPAQ